MTPSVVSSRKPAGLFEAHPVDVPAGGHAGLRLESAGEVARREPGAGGERFDGEVLAGVFGDPVLDLAQRFATGRLSGELGTELGLVPGSAQKDHQVTRHREGHLPAVVLLDERECEVDARGDPGGGGEPTVAYEDRLGVDLDGRIGARQVVADVPVGGHPVPVQLSGRGEEQGAAADGDEPFGARAVQAQPVDEAGGGVAGALTARDEEGVGCRGVGEAAVGDQHETAGRTHRRTVQRGGAQLVRDLREPRGTGEDLQGPGDIEALDAVEEDDEDGSLLHVSHPGQPGGRPQ